MTTKEALVNGGWGQAVPKGKLPPGVQIIINRQDEGHQWTTLHNGRVIERSWVSGTRTDARNAARRTLEACGLLTDGV